ncbi:MAG TPA: SDR family NAD(P)-dependent oxidoreductase [Thermoanaerobaculia bacterium]|nr:SDR family NAD(P)-dependent oxidoreductase [Thermoanaerobaculia bacterium]
MKTLLVTGGTGGLGTFVVERLSRDYRCVLLTHRDADLADGAATRAAITRLVDGPLYGVVHLAGGFEAGKVADTSDEVWAKMLALNTTGAFHVIREALPHLVAPARIVAVSSFATLTKARGIAAYTVSKSALNALIEVVAAELAGSGITANALLPDTLATPVNVSSSSDAKLVPLANVAESIAFLLSEEAASINGALIPLRGT